MKAGPSNTPGFGPHKGGFGQRFAPPRSGLQNPGPMLPQMGAPPDLAVRQQTMADMLRSGRKGGFGA